MHAATEWRWRWCCWWWRQKLWRWLHLDDVVVFIVGDAVRTCETWGHSGRKMWRFWVDFDVAPVCPFADIRYKLKFFHLACHFPTDSNFFSCFKILLPSSGFSACTSYILESFHVLSHIFFYLPPSLELHRELSRSSPGRSVPYGFVVGHQYLASSLPTNLPLRCLYYTINP